MHFLACGRGQSPRGLRKREARPDYIVIDDLDDDEYTCDIALYHMTASAPQKMGMEIRKERYERAIKWLEGVQAGKIVPDLPLAVDEYGEPIGIPMVYGCQKKLKHNW